MRLVWRWAGDLRLKNMGWGKLRGFFFPIFQDVEKCGETSDTKVFVYESRKSEDCVVSNIPHRFVFLAVYSNY